MRDKITELVYTIIIIVLVAVAMLVWERIIEALIMYNSHGIEELHMASYKLLLTVVLIVVVKSIIWLFKTIQCRNKRQR